MIVLTNQPSVVSFISNECKRTLWLSPVFRSPEESILSLFRNSRNPYYLLVDASSFSSEKEMNRILKHCEVYVKNILILGNGTRTELKNVYDKASLFNVLERLQSIQNASHSGFLALHMDDLKKIRQLPFTLYIREEDSLYRKTFHPLQTIDRNLKRTLERSGHEFLYYRAAHNSEYLGILMNRLIQRIEAEFSHFTGDEYNNQDIDSALELVHKMGLDSLMLTSGAETIDSGMMGEWKAIAVQMERFFIQNNLTFRYRLMELLFRLCFNMREADLSVEEDFQNLLHLKNNRLPGLQNLARWQMLGMEVCHSLIESQDQAVSVLLSNLRQKLEHSPLLENFESIFGKESRGLEVKEAVA